MAEKISDKAWSDFSDSDYTPEQMAKACLIFMGGDAGVKSNYKLRVREPDGTLNRNGVHAAAQRLGQTDAPKPLLEEAARKLVRLYGTLGESAPDSVMSMANMRVNSAIRQMAGR